MLQGCLCVFTCIYCSEGAIFTFFLHSLLFRGLDPMLVHVCTCGRDVRCTLSLHLIHTCGDNNVADLNPHFGSVTFH